MTSFLVDIQLARLFVIPWNFFFFFCMVDVASQYTAITCILILFWVFFIYMYIIYFLVDCRLNFITMLAYTCIWLCFDCFFFFFLVFNIKIKRERVFLVKLVLSIKCVFCPVITLTCARPKCVRGSLFCFPNTCLLGRVKGGVHCTHHRCTRIVTQHKNVDFQDGHRKVFCFLQGLSWSRICKTFKLFWGFHINVFLFSNNNSFFAFK